MSGSRRLRDRHLIFCTGGKFLQTIVTRLLCIALLAAVMVPIERLLFPYVSHDLTGIQFHAIEAVFSATIGFAISSIFG